MHTVLPLVALRRLQDNSIVYSSQKAMYVCTLIKHSGAVSDVPITWQIQCNSANPLIQSNYNIASVCTHVMYHYE